MTQPVGTEGQEIDIQALAAQMLGATDDDAVVDEGDDDEGDYEDTTGHPAWQEVLNQIPAEFRGQVAPVLQKWDTGVSRQFQKIHDQYAPLREFEELDPDSIREALGVYQALTDNPEATWEAIGRVYGLSPQQVSQAMSSDDDEDEDYLSSLPAGVRDRLSQLDVHEKVLSAVTDELLSRQAAEKEAQEDEELDEYIDSLHEEYGEFDEDFVIGLIASGIDGEDAVGEYQELVDTIATNLGGGASRSAPNVMSASGGIPNTGAVDPFKLSGQDTQNLVAEILRMTNENS